MTSPVRKTSAAVDKMAEDWSLIAAVMGGTKAMREAGKQYLPQWPAEDYKSYQARLATATFFPAYGRTVSVLTGKPFSKPVKIGEDVPAPLQKLLDDIDLQGRNLHSFASDLAEEALAFGLCGILVDCPPNPGAKTLADEQKAGIRPYWVHIRHNAILGWKTQKVGGSLQLSQLRLLESVEEADGDFGTKLIEQVRVLEPGKWSTWRKAKEADPDSWALDKEGVTTLTVIPFVPIYGRRDDFMIGCAPMLELAHANVEHWQSKSDQQTILHVARVPMLFAKDIGTETEIICGAGAMINASSATADVKYVEHSGKAIEAGRVSLLDLEDRMRQIGAELLVIKPGKATTVQVMAENEQGMCDLQRITESMEDAIDQALDLTAKWLKEAKGGHATIYKDFGAATLAEASAELLYKMRSSGSLSLETLLSECKRRGILSPEIEIDQEIVRAKADAPVETTQVTVKP
jgi:Domain of unknown function (DUF4055)